jgi:hypothetical protein
MIGTPLIIMRKKIENTLGILLKTTKI